MSAENEIFNKTLVGESSFYESKLVVNQIITTTEIEWVGL